MTMDDAPLHSEILQAIDDHPGWGFIELADHFDISFSVAAETVNEMLRNGELAYADDGPEA